MLSNRDLCPGMANPQEGRISRMWSKNVVHLEHIRTEATPT